LRAAVGAKPRHVESSRAGTLSKAMANAQRRSSAGFPRRRRNFESM